MTGRMRTSPAGIDLITRFEGFRETSAELPGGGFVIGYGHTTHAKARQRITEQDARTLLTGHDLPPIEKAIAARTLAPLGQNEFDALVAFAFNIGLDNFLESDVFALVNSGAKLNAAEAMAAWRKARVDGRVIVVDALVRRRAAERALFLEVQGGPTPTPTPLVRPILDLASAILHPRDVARRVEADEDDENGALRAGIIEEAHAGKTVDQEAPGAIESAPEAAARAVTERLTRILGEEAGLTPANDTPAPAAGPSVEEITQAISELADPVAEQAEVDLPEMGAEPRDLPPPLVQPHLRAVETKADEASNDEDAEKEEAEIEALPYPPVGTVRAQSGAHALALVDDLEEASSEEFEPDPDLHPETHGAPAPWGSLLLYAIAAFGGAMTGAWGLDHLFEVMNSNSPLQSDWDLYAGPFAMMVGGLVFLIMTYYLLRALFADN
ncbi:MAG: glycoside hydrolase family protein [Hyphomonadaceae bacterium]|nr:glycoside hydrolase family protein [Hyphomonadaceae bacterium]